MSPKHEAPLTIEHTLLGFLQDAPLHGYEIHQRLQAAEGLGLVWHIKQAHLYALLGKLEDAGLVEQAVSAQSGAPPLEPLRGRARRPLKLTSAGAQAFKSWVHSPVRHGRDLRIEFLAKLFWAQREDPTTAARLINEQRSVCQGWLAEIERAITPHDEQSFSQRLVLLFRRGQIMAMLDWLDTCAAMLVDLAATP